MRATRAAVRLPAIGTRVLRRVAFGAGVAVLLHATGCASAAAEREAWSYDGSDPALTMPMPTFVRADSAQVQANLYRDRFDEWRHRALAAVAAGKARCAAETGEPPTRSVWTGYGSAFLACMKSAGWSRDRSSNPL